jgi:hypothetical protein
MRSIGVVLALGMVGAASAQTLRERMEAARDAAAARAREEAAKREAERPRVKVVLDPEQDKDLWRIDKFFVPYESQPFMLGKIHIPGTEGRFYATLPKGGLPEELSEGTKVFFYVQEDEGLVLAGRGDVAKIRRKGKPVVEATVQACRYSEKRKRNNPMTGEVVQSLAIPGNKDPKKIRWYMSTKLKGPDVEGWGVEEMRNFALGQPWIGMSSNALLALLGTPVERFDAGKVKSFVYGVGPESIRYDVEDDRVTGRTQAGGF